MRDTVRSDGSSTGSDPVVGSADCGGLYSQKKLPTLALETEVRFASARKRSAFADELTQAIAKLVAKDHDEKAPGGRAFKLYLGAYSRPKRSRS